MFKEQGPMERVILLVKRIQLVPRFKFSARLKGIKLWLRLIGMSLEGNQMGQTKKWMLRGTSGLENVNVN